MILNQAKKAGLSDLTNPKSCEQSTKELVNQYKKTYLITQRVLLKLGMKEQSKELGKIYLETIK